MGQGAEGREGRRGSWGRTRRRVDRRLRTLWQQSAQRMHTTAAVSAARESLAAQLDNATRCDACWGRVVHCVPAVLSCTAALCCAVLQAMGQLLLQLACAVGGLPSPSLDFAHAHYSPEFVRMLMLLLGVAEGGAFSWRAVSALLGERLLLEMDTLAIFNEQLVGEALV